MEEHPTEQTQQAPFRPQRSNMAIVSFVLGIIAFLICWIPFIGFVGFPLSGLGLILGIGALIEISASKRSGSAFAVTGVIVCAVAIWVPIGMLRGCQAAVDNFRGSTEVHTEALASESPYDRSENDWRSDDSKDVADELAESVTNWLFKDVIEESATSMPAAFQPAMTRSPSLQPSATKPPLPPVPEKSDPEVTWAPQPVVVGDVKITIASATVGIVPLRQVTGDRSNSERRHLCICVKIENLTANRKINYRSFGGTHFGVQEEVATLHDNFGNPYDHIKFKLLAEPVGGVQEGSIYPRSLISDVLVFEEPIDGIEYLELRFPLVCVGSVGSKVVRIPKSMINWVP